MHTQAHTKTINNPSPPSQPKSTFDSVFSVPSTWLSNKKLIMSKQVRRGSTTSSYLNAPNVDTPKTGAGKKSAESDVSESPGQYPGHRVPACRFGVGSRTLSKRPFRPPRRMRITCSIITPPLFFFNAKYTPYPPHIHDHIFQPEC